MWFVDDVVVLLFFTRNMETWLELMLRWMELSTGTIVKENILDVAEGKTGQDVHLPVGQQL